MSSEVQRYITGIMTPVEMANPGPASISARQTVVVTYDDYAALEAENARLNDLISAARRVTGAVIEERDALRAELAEVKEREAVPVAHRLINCLGEAITEWKDGPPPDQITSACGVVQTDVVVESAYGLPPASPDVEGLVNELQRIAEKCSDPDTTDALDTALSTWRQGKEVNK